MSRLRHSGVLCEIYVMVNGLIENMQKIGNFIGTLADHDNQTLDVLLPFARKIVEADSETKNKISDLEQKLSSQI